MARIGFVGLGRMGLPMALNAAKAGHTVKAFDVSTAYHQAATEAGIVPCNRPEDATADCEFAVTMVPTGKQVHEAPASRYELSDVCRPQAQGGTLDEAGVTECVSSLARDGSAVPHAISHGTFVVGEAAEDNDYTRACFKEYYMLPDSSGRYAALYRPVYFSGLELGVSVAWAALYRQPTGAPVCFNADVVATAKKGLRRGEVLDGEGGFCVWGKQLPAATSLANRLLPLGLAQSVTLTRDVSAGECLQWADVSIDENDEVVVFRREMECAFGISGGKQRILPSAVV